MTLHEVISRVVKALLRGSSLIKTREKEMVIGEKLAEKCRLTDVYYVSYARYIVIYSPIDTWSRIYLVCDKRSDGTIVEPREVSEKSHTHRRHQFHKVFNVREFLIRSILQSRIVRVKKRTSLVSHPCIRLSVPAVGRVEIAKGFFKRLRFSIFLIFSLRALGPQFFFNIPFTIYI